MCNYKYLQSSSIHEGRELFVVSEDGRIHSSVLKLQKEVFRLDHLEGVFLISRALV